MRVSSWTWTSPLAVPVSAVTTGGGRGGRRGGAAAGAAARAPGAAAPVAAASTSALHDPPAGAGAAQRARSTPRSRAMRRATRRGLDAPVAASPSTTAGAGAAGSRARRHRPRPRPRAGAARRGRRAAVRWPPRAAPPAPRPRRSRPSRRRRGRLAPPPIVAIDLPDRQRVALGGDDLEHAGGVGLVGHRRLVGLDLDELLAALHLVAVGLEPLQDRALLHRVGQAGHDDVGHGVAAPRRSRKVASAASTTCGSCGKAICSSGLE